jgi:hypothetical protein
MTPSGQKVDRNDLSGGCVPLRRELVQFLSEQVSEEVAGLVSGQDQNNFTIPESPDAIKDIQPYWWRGGEDPERKAVEACISEIKSFLESQCNFLRTYVAGELDSRSLKDFFIHSIPRIHSCIALDYDELRKFNNNRSPFHLPTDQLLRCIPRCELPWQAGRDRRKEIFRLLRRLNMVSTLARSDVGPLEELLPELEDYLRTLKDLTMRGIPDRGVRAELAFPAEPMGSTVAGVAGERGDAGEPRLVEGECSPSSTSCGGNEEREQFVYQLCCDGVPYKNICTQLQKEHPDWKQIGSVQGVRHVALTYATQHGLPPPKARRRPRQQR